MINENPPEQQNQQPPGPPPPQQNQDSAEDQNEEEDQEVYRFLKKYLKFTSSFHLLSEDINYLWPHSLIDFLAFIF